MKAREIEEKIINKILPRIERKLVPKITKRIVDEINKEEYPPEMQFKKSFIRKVKAAQKRIREGKGRTYTYDEFKRKFLKAKR